MQTVTLRKLKEMIEELVEEEGDEVLNLKVMASYDYGDYYHTEALVNIGRVEVVNARETAYSESGFCIRDEDDHEEGNKIVALTRK